MAQRASKRPGKAQKSPACTGKSTSILRNAQQHFLSGKERGRTSIPEAKKEIRSAASEEERKARKET
ncbi:hypothetical protein OO006_04230 [Prosthecochloris sp. SCSIO W1101]|uniref:hypothetical protein n=1 Tax=Prosthecochloris sp. SCSIO W1101 TaxID=2992242 RepID=UPI00223CB649|nr:hypothetical protein [Prosthecochloris sp. SCSIO W1101]UZJ42188.1 hypothetical protein OO006_04230 [Prosthecochloris sp. SCSIO W1101]